MCCEDIPILIFSMCRKLLRFRDIRGVDVSIFCNVSDWRTVAQSNTRCPCRGWKRIVRGSKSSRSDEKSGKPTRRTALCPPSTFRFPRTVFRVSIPSRPGTAGVHTIGRRGIYRRLTRPIRSAPAKRNSRCKPCSPQRRGHRHRGH